MLTAALLVAALLGSLLAVVVGRIVATRRGSRQPQKAQKGEHDALTMLVEGVRDFGIVILDANGRVTSCNQGAALIQGYAHDEIIGRDLSAFYLSEDAQQGQPAAAMALAAEHGQVEEEGWRQRKDGSRFWASVILAALRDPGGRLLGYGEVIRDATARKAAESKLNRALSILAATLEATSGGIIVVDNSDRVVNVNLHFAQMWELPLETAMAFHDEPVMSKVLQEVKDPAAFRRTMLDVAARPAGESYDNIDLRDGRVFERQSRPHRIGEDIVGRVWTYRDITQRKVVEDELMRALGQAVETSHAKSRFVAAASHDLRQPLQALAMLSAALEPHIAGASGRALFRKVNQSVESLTGLFDALLDVSRLDAGQVPMVREPVALSSLFAELRAHFESLALANNLKFHVVPTNAVVISDPAQLQRIVANLLVNAISYTRGGAVMICARRAGANMRIEVRDSGIGVPAQEHEAIFQEFYQLANPERDRRKGLGLGLAIARRIATQLGHTITLRSAPHKGSVFGVVVPRTSDAVQPLPVEPMLGDRLNGLKVMIIDDEADVRDAIGALLQRWSCEAWLADTPSAATALIEKHGRAPDAIVCDYRLREGHDGISAIAALRTRWGAIPAALLSGDVSDPIRNRARAAALPFLRKPVRPATLRATLNQITRRE